MRKKRMIFMGSAALACPSLDGLRSLSGAQIVGVVTQPERPCGRSLRKTPCPVCVHVARLGIPVFMPEDVNAPDSVKALRALQPDLIVVVAYGQILKNDILTLPPLQCVNLHASLLPEYRGAAPIQWAIAHGERETGVTTMFMNQGMDTGDIIFQEVEKILPDDTGSILHDRLAARGAGLLARTIEAILAGQAPRQPQNHDLATYAPRLKKADGLLNWDLTATDLANRVRAFNPWPACHLTWPGAKPLSVKVLAARAEFPEISATTMPGTLLEAAGEGPLISAGTGALRLLTLQPEGKKLMSGAAFLCGYCVQPGTRM